MSWDYRVVRVDGQMRIYDVYYDAAGQPISRHEQPTYVYGDTVEELREQIALISDALEQPVLDDCEIGSEGGGQVETSSSQAIYPLAGDRG